jgi:5,6,7,8-tetrahydromethanopterin hydro-lyase
MRRPSCPREHAIADDAALDFTGTFEDCSHPRVAPIAFDSPFCGVAVAAVELHGLIGDAHGHFGGEQLHLRGLAFRRLALIQQMRDLLPEGSSLGDLGGHVGQRKPQRLKLTDRMAELLALLTNNKDGFTTLLALVAPNLMCKPPTILYNKVTIKDARQAVQMFGPAQHAVAKAVADSVAEGVIPANEAADLFITVGVFIHWDAKDDKKIQDFNYRATKEALARAVKGEPTASEVTAKKDSAHHPFAAG